MTPRDLPSYHQNMSEWVVEDSEDELDILPRVSLTSLLDDGLTRGKFRTESIADVHDGVPRSTIPTTSPPPPSSLRTVESVRRSPGISTVSLFTPVRESEIASFTPAPLVRHSSPLSSPPTPVRKRKRTPVDVIVLDDDDESDRAPARLPSEGPALFFASSSSLSSLDSGIVARALRKDIEEDGGKPDKVPTKSKATKGRAKGKGKGKKKADDEPQNERTPAPKALDVPAKTTKPRARPNVKRKGKRKTVVSDEEDAANPPAPVPSPPSPRAAQVLAGRPAASPAPAANPTPPSSKVKPSSHRSHARANSTACTQENRPPDRPQPQRPRCPPPIVKPKATPMSELIRRVNSQPSSPFPNALRTYSPFLKSSRTMLARIAPLHPNRRTPPPPLPRPPPPKKSNKQIAMEERIEEELSETVEGWSCMGEEERKGLLRARIDMELGYE